MEEEKMLMEQIVSFVEDEDEGNDLSTWLFLFKTVYPFFSDEERRSVSFNAFIDEEAMEVDSEESTTKDNDSDDDSLMSFNYLRSKIRLTP